MKERQISSTMESVLRAAGLEPLQPPRVPSQKYLHLLKALSRPRGGPRPRVRKSS